MSETLLLILLLVPALIVAIVFHEIAHGWTALMLGDPTAKEQRRLSLNPIRHVDPIGTLLVPGALALSGGPIFGWAKPVPVLKQRLDNPRFGMMAVAAAGPGTNLILAAIGAIALGLVAPSLGGTAAEPGFAVQALFYFILINLSSAQFTGGPIVFSRIPSSGANQVSAIKPRRRSIPKGRSFS